MKLQRSLETNASPEAVFAYLSDFTNTNEWDPGTVHTELVSGDGGVGTTYHNVSKFMGRETEYRVFYSETQDGNMVRGDRVTGETVSIRLQAAPGEPALRWHWDTPLTLSPQDHKVLYAAAQKVFR